MNEKQLISKIRQLRQIKPNKEWVSFTKTQILGEEIGYRERFIEVFEVFSHTLFQTRLAYAAVTVFLVLIGMFGFAQNTVPGDFLFSIKKTAERTQGVFVSGNQQPKYNLEIVNKRLEDLTRIAINNQVKNLSSAIDELQSSVSEAAKSLIERNGSIKEIAQEVKKIERNKQVVESLGIVIDENEELKELDNALSQVVQREINSLEDASLTEESQGILEEAKIDYENGNYSQALEKILQISNQ